MVILSDLFDLLATGELANTNLSKTPTGNLSEKEYNKVIGHLNLGILELHKRFRLMVKELTLHALPSVQEYYLHPKRVSSINNMGKNAYIQETGDNNKALNIVKVLDAYDSIGDNITINNRHSVPSIRTISNDILKITKLDAAMIISIEYQAYPDKIVIEDDFDPSEYTVYIPEFIIEPLLFYVASRIYKPMGANDSTANADKSVSYQQQYELACQKIDVYGLDPQNNDNENTFEDDGWA